MLEGPLEFQAAPADVLQILAQQTHLNVGFDGRARFHDLLLIHQNFSGKDERLRAFARGHQAAFHQQLVESRFHFPEFKKFDRMAEKFYHERASIDDSAEC